MPRPVGIARALRRAAGADRGPALGRRAARARPGAVGARRPSADALGPAARGARVDGHPARVLIGVEQRLQELPRIEDLVDEARRPAASRSRCSSASSSCSRPARTGSSSASAPRTSSPPVAEQAAQTVRDTWELIDLKLGAYVRGQALLVAVRRVVLSVVFWAIGLPFWLLVALFAGVVEIVPVIGPLAAGPRGRRRAHRVGRCRDRRGRRGAARPPARGLRRDPARARRGGRPLAADRARLGRRPRRCSSASSPSCSRSRWPPSSRRSST